MRLALLLACVSLAACGLVGPTPSPTPSPTPAAHDIIVLLALSGTDAFDVVATGCAGKDGYSDIKLGLQFNVKDASGTLIGFGSFEHSEVDIHNQAALSTCRLFGTAPGVPDEPIYSIESGRRGTVNFTRAQLEANGWEADLTLGQ